MRPHESIGDDAAPEWYGDLGYAVGSESHLSPGEATADMDSFGEVVVERLRAALRRLNGALGEVALDALREALRVSFTVRDRSPGMPYGWRCICRRTLKLVPPVNAFSFQS